MLKFLNFRNLLLSCSLLVMPGVAQATSQNHSNDLLQSVLRAKNNICKHKKAKRFNLKDIAGEWVVQIETVGGVLSPTGEGRSFVAEGQLRFDRSGKQSINFFRVATYSGDVGDIQYFTMDNADSNATIKITDAKHGIAKISSTTPFGEKEFSLILIRDRRGRVIQMLGMYPEETNPPSANFVSTVTFTRQDL